jgi:hypothetical protein
MDDLISRQAAIDALVEILDRPNHAEFLYGDEICGALGSLPSAQSGITLESAIDYLHSIGWIQEHDRILTESAQPEIIHCESCEHWKNEHICECLSRYGTFETPKNFYCGYGKRRTDEKENI